MNEKSESVTEQGESIEKMVLFSSADLLVMIAALTNATIRLSTAITHIARGSVEAAEAANRQAGEQIDQILSVMREKVPGAVDGDR